MFPLDLALAAKNSARLYKSDLIRPRRRRPSTGNMSAGFRISQHPSKETLTNQGGTIMTHETTGIPPLTRRIPRYFTLSNTHEFTREHILVQEERRLERTRIARELHDTWLQGLLSASMQLQVAEGWVPHRATTNPTGAGGGAPPTPPPNAAGGRRPHPQGKGNGGGPPPPERLPRRRAPAHTPRAGARRFTGEPPPRRPRPPANRKNGV